MLADEQSRAVRNVDTEHHGTKIEDERKVLGGQEGRYTITASQKVVRNVDQRQEEQGIRGQTKTPWWSGMQVWYRRPRKYKQEFLVPGRWIQR